MKAVTLMLRRHATCTAEDTALIRPRRMLALPMLLAATISTGCVSSVPEPVLVREPRPEAIPLRIGVYDSLEFRNYTYRSDFSDTAWILGKPSVQLLHEALRLLFLEVVEVPRPGSEAGLHGDLAGVIEPQIVSASAKLLDRPYSNPAAWAVDVTYRFILSSPNGAPLASWQVTGWGKEPVSFSQLTPRRSYGRAMREAAWKFTSGFHDIPEVKRWLAEQADRKD